MKISLRTTFEYSKRNIGKRKANCKYILQRNLYNDRRSYFQGRKRGLSEHRKIRKKLGLASTVLSSDDYIPPLGLLEKCTLLDKMPLAFCVIDWFLMKKVTVLILSSDIATNDGRCRRHTCQRDD